MAPAVGLPSAAGARVRALRALIAAPVAGWRRAARTPGRWLPVTFALAIACAYLGWVLAGAVIAADSAAHERLRSLSPSQAAVSLSWSGAAGPRVDREARSALKDTGVDGVHRGLLMVPVSYDRRLIRLSAATHLAGSVKLIAGRLPRAPCRQSRCEVLRVAGPPLPRTIAGRGLTLVVTGTALVTDRTLFSLTTKPSDLRATADNRAPALLLAADPAGVDSLTAVSSVSRTQTWSGQLPLASVHSWNLGSTLDRLGRVRQSIDAHSDSFTFSGPEARVAAVKARADAVPGRFRATAAVGLACVLAFLVLAAIPMRRAIQTESERLTRAGSSGGQRMLAVAAETALPAGAGLVLGAAAGLALAVTRASDGVGAGRLLDQTARPLLVASAILAAGAWALVATVGSLPGRVLRVLAAAALLATASALLALGASDRLAGAPLPAGVIPLMALLAALVAGLGLAPLMRLLARSPLGTRSNAGLAVVELARDPAAAAGTAAALAAAVGIAGFALAYHQTVDRGQDAQAAARVPLDAQVSAGPSLAPPLRAATLTDWRRRSHATVLPVLREQVQAYAGPSATSAAIIGLPAKALQRVAGGSQAAADRLRPPAWRMPFKGSRIPRTAAALSLDARTTAASLELTLYLRDADGYATSTVNLGTVTPAGGRWRAAIPPRARGGTVDALVVAPTLGEEVTSTHQLAEGGGGAGALTGTLTVSALRLGTARASLGGFRGFGGLRGTGGRFHFRLDGTQTALARLPSPADRSPLPVLASPGLAADARISHGLTVHVAGVKLQAQVVGVTARLPTVHSGTPVLLADAQALVAALDAAAPGTAQVRRLWIGGDTRLAARAARRDGLSVVTHAAVLARLRAQPVGRQLLRVVVLTALLGILLCAAGLMVATRAQLRGDPRALADLEAQGVGPRALRANLRMRAAVVAVAACVLGLACAFWLDSEVALAARVAFDAQPDPPLAGSTPVAATVAVAAASALVALAAVAAVLRRSLRGPVPLRMHGGDGP